MANFENGRENGQDYPYTQDSMNSGKRESVFTIPGSNTGTPPQKTEPPAFPGSGTASTSNASAKQAAPKQPLKSPRVRPTISTNRIFSPYDFSFFDEPVTTRDLSSNERARMAAHNSSRNQTNTSVNHVAFTRSSGTSSRPASSQDAQPQQVNRTAPRQTTTPAGRILTPEKNVFPSEAASAPRPAASQQRRPQPSATRPAAAPRTTASSTTGTMGILTPDNNYFPEDSRSIRNTASLNRPATADRPASGATISSTAAKAARTPAFNTPEFIQTPTYSSTSSAQASRPVQQKPTAATTRSASTARPASTQAAPSDRSSRRAAPGKTPVFNLPPASSNTDLSKTQVFNTAQVRTASTAAQAPASSRSDVSATQTRLFTSPSVSTAPASTNRRPASKPTPSSMDTGATTSINFSALKEASIPAAGAATKAAADTLTGAAALGTAAFGAAAASSSRPVSKPRTSAQPPAFQTPKSHSGDTGFITGSLSSAGTTAEEDAGKTVAINTQQVKDLSDAVPQELPEPYEETDELEQTASVKPKRKPKQRIVETDTGGPNGPDDPDSGSSRKEEQPKRWFVILTAVLCVAVLLELIGGITGIVLVNKMTANAPDLNLTDFVGEESTKIYDDQGELVTEVGVYLRQNISYDKCPEALVDAFLSIEDSRFFSHFGFDIPRFTKALIDNIKTHSFGQGGSTFTMQLVKNTYFSVESMDAEDTGTERTRSIEYKVQQIYLAIKLERLLSKKEIFTLYLNKLNFGGNIRGVQRASQYYFGKNCNELNLAESAMLAGIVNLPNRYNPYDYLDYGTTRRNQVLQLMKNHGYISEDELTLAKGIKVEDTLVGEIREAAEDSQYQSYIDVVLEEAMELTGSDPTVKGMNIYTHLNRAMQEEVEAIQNGESTVVYPDDLIQVAMISMDNRNGAIVAVGGGRNYDGARLLNRATMNYKQPGSSVKPLLSYALAFEYLGYSLDEVLLDKPITYPMESMVLVNASGNYAGDVTIKDAVGNSLNIPAILTLERVVNKIGPEKVVEYLNTIGFSRVKQENFHLSYAIGGTTFETTCKELAGAHAMLINKGVYNQPHTIEKVVMTSDGSEYYTQNQNVRALSSGSAYLATELEANNVTGSYFNYMQLLARSYPVYAKTGTTDWGNDGVQYGIPRGQMKDKWMVASTSQYTNCVWVGYDKAEAGKETYYTSYKSSLNIPGNINRLLLNKEEEIWGVPEAIPQPEDVQNVTYIYGTFPHVRQEFAIDGGGTVTSLVSNAGLESMPLASVDEFLEYSKSEAEYLGTKGFSARFDQFNILTVSWAGSNGICSGGQRNIGLHDPYNDIDQWGACLADLSWLVGGGEYWGTVYCDDVPVGEFSSNNGFFSGYVADLYGEVKVCGGSATADGSDNTACTVAQYYENPNTNGYVDENGNWVQLEPDYSQYGYWDENGNWVGQGHWDENGFHPE